MQGMVFQHASLPIAHVQPVIWWQESLSLDFSFFHHFHVEVEKAAQGAEKEQTAPALLQLSKSSSDILMLS